MWIGTPINHNINTTQWWIGANMGKLTDLWLNSTVVKIHIQLAVLNEDRTDDKITYCICSYLDCLDPAAVKDQLISRPNFKCQKMSLSWQTLEFSCCSDGRVEEKGNAYQKLMDVLKDFS